MQYERAEMSYSLKKMIVGRAYTNQQQLERKSRSVIPLHELVVGESFWCDLDTSNIGEVHSIRTSLRHYNHKGDVQFVARKHRGDMRKTGFKYLEVGRVK